jgi:hypothetical protein
MEMEKPIMHKMIGVSLMVLGLISTGGMAQAAEDLLLACSGTVQSKSPDGQVADEPVANVTVAVSSANVSLFFAAHSKDNEIASKSHYYEDGGQIGLTDSWNQIVINRMTGEVDWHVSGYAYRDDTYKLTCKPANPLF